jgi:hypothetical protein
MPLHLTSGVDVKDLHPSPRYCTCQITLILFEGYTHDMMRKQKQLEEMQLLGDQLAEHPVCERESISFGKKGLCVEHHYQQATKKNPTQDYVYARLFQPGCSL